MRRLLAYWFTFSGRVTRREYLLHGAVLMALKYAADAALIFALAGASWWPSDYLRTGVVLAQSKLATGPSWLPLLLGAWTMPFLWAGLALTARRAVDARVTPWFSLLFVVPVANYLAILALCIAPTAGAPLVPPPTGATSRATGGSVLAAAGVGAIIGTTLAAVSVLFLESYGAALFIGSPFVMGAIAAWVLNRRSIATAGQSTFAALASLVLAAAMMIAFAMEGVICLVFAAPLSLAIAWLGGNAGRFFALNGGETVGALAVIALLPLATPAVDARTPVLVREVRTIVEIDAPPDVVWRNVVEFPPLARSRSMLFRAGIAEPVGARIEGEGIGAMRYCEFTTGDFVEPVTAWEPGRRLTFDITANPAPMRELSPYRIKPPHLGGFFRATRGQFVLEPIADGRTRVIGSTWYELDIHPAPYYALYADFIVERIHERVLDHIATLSSEDGAPSAPPRPGSE